MINVLTTGSISGETCMSRSVIGRQRRLVAAMTVPVRPASPAISAAYRRARCSSPAPRAWLMVVRQPLPAREVISMRRVKTCETMPSDA